MKSVQIRSFFWSEYWKIRTRKNFIFGHFSQSETLTKSNWRTCERTVDYMDIIKVSGLFKKTTISCKGDSFNRWCLIIWIDFHQSKKKNTDPHHLFASFFAKYTINFQLKDEIFDLKNWPYLLDLRIDAQNAENLEIFKNKSTTLIFHHSEFAKTSKVIKWFKKKKKKTSEVSEFPILSYTQNRKLRNLGKIVLLPNLTVVVT